MGADWIYWAAQALHLFLIVFYGGYFMLAMAGLAGRLLPQEIPPEEEAPEAASEAPAAPADTDAGAGNGKRL